MHFLAYFFDSSTAWLQWSHICILLLVQITLLLVYRRKTLQKLEAQQHLLKNQAEISHEMERRFSDMFDRNRSVMYVTDAETNQYLYVNEACVNFYGYPREKMLAMKTGAINVTPFEELIKEVETADRENRSVVFKHELANKDVRTVQIRGTSIVWGGRPANFSVLIDITQQIETREALLEAKQEVEKRFRAMFDDNLSVMYIVDNETHKFLYVNEACTQFYGYSRKEMLSFFTGQINVTPLDELEAEIKAAGRENRAVVFQHKLANGDIRTVQIRGTLIPWGNRLAQFAVLVDITSQIRNEKALIKAKQEAEGSAALLEAIFENLPDHIYYKDRRSHVLGMNPACYQHHGASSAEELIGKTDLDLHPAPLGQQLYDNEQRQMETGEVTRVRERHVRPDGKAEYVESIKSPFKNKAGETIGLVGISRDITKQVENERSLITAQQEAEAANKAKSSFLAMMSHEIRTPMNGVIGASSLLLGTELNEQQEDFVHTIQVSGENLMTIINDILDYSKIEAGKIDLEAIPFVLRECIENAFDLFVQVAAKKNLELLYYVEPDVPESLIGDPTRLRQILVNLLGNAIKFTEKGEVSIHVHVLTRDENNDRCQLEFSVRDTGVGIPEESQKQLFQSFTQADVSSTRKYGGTGLGLAISRRLTELMGGQIWFESKEGNGSTFYFTSEMPISSARKKQTNELPTEALRGKRILIIDDNETNRNILCAQMEQWGAIPQAFAHPEQVVAHLQENPPYDMALMDYQMPGMDGATLAKAIHKLPDYPHLPIIMLSSSYETIPPHPSISARMAKPIKVNKLRHQMLQLFGEKGELETGATRADTRIRPKKTQSLRILVAEDNRINRRVSQMMLQRLGYDRAVFVEDGQEAVAAVIDADYDIVLMDVQMPHMNGLEATREIRKHTKSKTNPWIIALTAGVMEDERKEIIKAGMNGFLAKPLSVEQLEEKLDAACEMLSHL